MKIAYIVYTEKGPSVFNDPEHDLVLQYLKDKGLDIHKEEWSDESVNWSHYQRIVLKSPWDYVAKTKMFYNWLAAMESMNIPMLNPAAIVRWNSDKHYLQDIIDAGLKVIPTRFLERGSSFDAEDHFRHFDTSEIIVKPCVSGSSRNTFKLSEGNHELTRVINEILQQESMMVQPFMPQISEGEWSLVFFGGRFSHALTKTPRGEDFRAQPQFGGAVRAVIPDAKIREAAAAYVSHFAKDCLYARVDGLIINGEFYLMELELIDPILFLYTHPPGYENYYQALKAGIGLR